MGDFYGVPSNDRNPSVPTVLIASTLQPASRRDGLSFLLMFVTTFINEKILSFFEFIVFASEFLKVAATVRKQFPSLTSHDIADTFINSMPDKDIRSALRGYLKDTIWLDLSNPSLMVRLAIFGRMYFPITPLWIPSISRLWCRNIKLNRLSTSSARTILYLLELHFSELVAFPSKFTMAHLVEFKNRIAEHCIQSLTIEEFADDVAGIKMCTCDIPSHPELAPGGSVVTLPAPLVTLVSPVDVDIPDSPIFNPFRDEDIFAIQERANALKAELDSCIREHEEMLREQLYYQPGPIFNETHGLHCTSVRMEKAKAKH